MNAPGWRLAASTLGAPDEDLPSIIDVLTRHGADAIELRAAHDALVHVDLESDERAVIRTQLEVAGIEVLAVASRVRIASAQPDDEVVAELRAHLRLAADLGARFVRVFPGAPTHPTASDRLPQLTEPVEVADRRAAARLESVAELALELGVRPVLETHDSHPRGTDVARVLALLDPTHPVGAIWDALHPWRVGEPLAETAAALLPHLVDGNGYVQVKDVASPSDTTPVLQGSGSVPVAAMLELLRAGGYAGPVSLEWERTWHPSVAPLDAALEAAARSLERMR